MFVYGHLMIPDTGRTDGLTITMAIEVADVGGVPLTITDRGQGHLILLLHGGGGPPTVSGFADLLAGSEHARVITPTHPGFDGTPRPTSLDSVGRLAALHVNLLDELNLSDVTVIGNSVGGWIAAEMAILGSERVSSVILVDAVGIDVPEHPVVDFFSLTMDDVARLSYHDPDTFGIDPTKLPPAAQAAMATNRVALAVYGGAGMTDPGLNARLSAITVPTLVLRGASDRIVDPDFGRAFASAIPAATFRLLEGTGHLPQIETPDLLLRAVWEFAAAHATSRPAS